MAANITLDAVAALLAGGDRSVVYQCESKASQDGLSRNPTTSCVPGHGYGGRRGAR
jgi:hypothetical protein